MMRAVDQRRGASRKRMPTWAQDAQTLADRLEGDLQGTVRQPVRGISIDTRTLRPGDLFVALRGPRFDGHDYLLEAAEAGAAAAVVDRSRAADLPRALPFYVVDDPLRAMQRLAAAHRRSCDVRVVLVTGSCGKTTTKEFTASVLGTVGHVLKTRGNRNNEIGVPLTLLELVDEEYAVIEAGTNHPGELAALVEICRPDLAVITGVGPAHLEFFGDEEGVAREKSTAIRHLPPEGAAVLPYDDDWFAYFFGRAGAPVLSFGFDRRAEFRASRVEMNWEMSSFLLHLPDGTTTRVHLPYPGRFNILNALAAAAVGHHFEVPIESYLDGIARATLPALRSDIRTVGGVTIYADCYNSNPQSMESALRTLSELPVAGRRIAVVCEMLELGPGADEWHRRVGRQAALLGVDWLLAVGAARAAAESAGVSGSALRAEAVETNREAARRLLDEMVPGDAVLIKGSRGAQPEAILEALVPELENRRG